MTPLHTVPLFSETVCNPLHTYSFRLYQARDAHQRFYETQLVQ